jgi:hypothetical protein
VHVTRRALRLSLAASLVAALGLVSTAAAADLTKDQCVDANTRAQDLRRDGKLAAAGEQLRACAATSCPAMVRDDCARRLDEIDRAQPSFVFDVKDAAGADVIAVKIGVDGQPLVDHLDGKPLKVDPGIHVFSFEVAGHAPVSRQMLVKEGEAGRHERIVVEDEAAEPTTGLASSALAQPETSTAPSPSSSGLGTQRAVGLVLGGAGVAGLGVGTVFGLFASGAWSKAESACGPTGVKACASTGVTEANSDRRAAVTDGTAATIGFIAGGVLVATGAVLFFTGGHHEGGAGTGAAVTAILAPGQAGIVVSGAF